jgi:hypothetical protein
VADAYYELIDQSASLGERFGATEYVRSAWDAAIQNGAPVSALLVRALERCSPRQGVRLSRVVVDLLGPVPICDELWVSVQISAGTLFDQSGAVAKIQQAQLLRPRGSGR